MYYSIITSGEMSVNISHHNSTVYCTNGAWNTNLLTSLPPSSSEVNGGLETWNTSLLRLPVSSPFFSDENGQITSEMPKNSDIIILHLNITILSAIVSAVVVFFFILIFIITIMIVIIVRRKTRNSKLHINMHFT